MYRKTSIIKTQTLRLLPAIGMADLKDIKILVQKSTGIKFKRN